MTRLEFSRSTRREALDRSRIDGMPRCEAVGADYGLPAGQRCYVPLASGVEFDHRLPAELGGDNSLENCVSACRSCHRFKTAGDVRRIRKADRQRDKNSGAFKPSANPIPGSRNTKWKRKLNGQTVERQA